MRRRTHTPIRTCVGCGCRAAQPELLRLVMAADGGLALVHLPRHAGRSGYLHRREECWVRFAARQGRIRSLGSHVDKPTRAALVRELQRTAQSAILTR